MQQYYIAKVAVSFVICILTCHPCRLIWRARGWWTRCLTLLRSHQTLRTAGMRLYRALTYPDDSESLKYKKTVFLVNQEQFYIWRCFIEAHRVCSPGLTCISGGRSFWKVLKTPQLEMIIGARTSTCSSPFLTVTPVNQTTINTLPFKSLETPQPISLEKKLCYNLFSNIISQHFYLNQDFWLPLHIFLQIKRIILSVFVHTVLKLNVWHVRVMRLCCKCSSYAHGHVYIRCNGFCQSTQFSGCMRWMTLVKMKTYGLSYAY